MSHDCTRAIIDLDAVSSNFDAVCRKAKVPVMAVIKADAYGHGLLPAALAAQKALDPDRNMLLDYDELKGLRAHFDDLLSPFMRVAVQGGYVRPR